MNERPSDMRNTKRALSHNGHSLKRIQIRICYHLSAFITSSAGIHSPSTIHCALLNGQFIGASTITATKRGLIRCSDNSFNAAADKANNICKSLLFALSVRVSVARDVNAQVPWYTGTGFHPVYEWTFLCHRRLIVSLINRSAAVLLRRQDLLIAINPPSGCCLIRISYVRLPVRLFAQRESLP